MTLEYFRKHIHLVLPSSLLYYLHPEAHTCICPHSHLRGWGCSEWVNREAAGCVCRPEAQPQLQDEGESEECLICQGDNLNSAVALLWAGNQWEGAGMDTVPVSAGCAWVSMFRSKCPHRCYFWFIFVLVFWLNISHSLLNYFSFV